MARIVHVEITTDAVAGTAQFYANLFGLAAEPSPFLPDYTLLTGEDGPSTAIMARTYQDQKVIIWFEVEDIEAALAAVEAESGRRIGHVNTIPGQGRLAYAQDPNGTIFGLKQARMA